MSSLTVAQPLAHHILQSIIRATQPSPLIVPPKSQRPAHPGRMPKAKWCSTIHLARIAIAAQAGGISDKDQAGLAAACPSRVDASGKAVYDDPTCPDRFRRQVSEKDRAVLAAACPSRIDTTGNTVYVYDDPTCPRRYHHQISWIREARISLSRAAGIKKWDEPSAVAEKERAALAAACPSQVDATGNSVYDDPSYRSLSTPEGEHR